MADFVEKNCPQCDQKLRFPKGVGGIVMVCPSCGKKFSSDFKLGGAQSSTSQQGLFMTIFEMPWKIVSYIGRIFLQK